MVKKSPIYDALTGTHAELTASDKSELTKEAEGLDNANAAEVSNNNNLLRTYAALNVVKGDPDGLKANPGLAQAQVATLDAALKKGHELNHEKRMELRGPSVTSSQDNEKEQHTTPTLRRP